jgi:glycosyltransferase involved in cell wall biosynthesis
VYPAKEPLHILRVLLAVRETSAPYNQFSLPWADKHETTLCTYFASDLTPPRTITCFEGDGSLSGFWRNLKAALTAKAYDVIHVHSPHLGLLSLLMIFFTDRSYLSATVLTVHDSYQNYKWRNRLLLLPVFAFFRRIVCCSRASYESFPALFRWLAGERLRVVQNGLDVARIDRIAAELRHTRGQKAGFTIVAISRLVAIKNPFAVLAALHKCGDPTYRLVYIGAGPLRDALISKRQALGLVDQVEFTGLIPREQVFEHLLNADLFLSLSCGEGLPVSVLEAMACRCPVLLSDIPPHREIAAGSKFIPLIAADDALGFAHAIQRFRDLSSGERALIGQRCRKVVEERFSLPAMHAAYEEIYGEITRHQRSLAVGVP